MCHLINSWTLCIILCVISVHFESSEINKLIVLQPFYKLKLLRDFVVLSGVVYTFLNLFLYPFPWNNVLLLFSHNTKTTSWLDPRLAKKAKPPEECKENGECPLDGCICGSSLYQNQYLPTKRYFSWCSCQHNINPVKKKGIEKDKPYKQNRLQTRDWRCKNAQCNKVQMCTDYNNSE